MTRQLETVTKTVRGLSERRQDELAELMTQALQPNVKYTAAQVAVIEASIAQADVGEFVSDERMEQIFPDTGLYENPPYAKCGNQTGRASGVYRDRESSGRKDAGCPD